MDAWLPQYETASVNAGMVSTDSTAYHNELYEHMRGLFDDLVAQELKMEESTSQLTQRHSFVANLTLNLKDRRGRTGKGANPSPHIIRSRMENPNSSAWLLGKIDEIGRFHIPLAEEMERRTGTILSLSNTSKRHYERLVLELDSAYKLSLRDLMI